MSENNGQDTFGRIPRWLWGLLVAATGWATHVSIQLAALNVRVDQTASTSERVETTAKLVTELLITIREHDKQISRLNEKSEQQLERLHRLELQRDQRLPFRQDDSSAQLCRVERRRDTRSPEVQ